jgi:hypothetical protein
MAPGAASRLLFRGGGEGRRTLLRAMAAAAAAEGGVNGAAEGRGRRGFMPAGRGSLLRKEKPATATSTRIYLVGPTGLVPFFLLQV